MYVSVPAGTAYPYYRSDDATTCRIHLAADSLYHTMALWDMECIQEFTLTGFMYSLQKKKKRRESSCYVYLVWELSESHSSTVIITKISYFLYIEATQSNQVL